METRPPAKILIVDDHPLLRSALSILVNDEPDLSVCGEAADADEALRRFDAERPELAVVDISLESGSGLGLIRQLRARDPHLKVMVLSMHDEFLYAERALRAGAMGYVNKREAPSRVIEAIREVLAGRLYFSERVLQRIDRLAEEAEAGGSGEDSPLQALSDRELEVFMLIGQGLGTSQIAERLSLSIKTIETHRDKIKRKLRLDSGHELHRYAMQWVIENG